MIGWSKDSGGDYVFIPPLIENLQDNRIKIYSGSRLYPFFAINSNAIGHITIPNFYMALHIDRIWLTKIPYESTTIQISRKKATIIGVIIK